MNYDEFAFFNDQLGSMLRDGIPLEGALKQLALGMETSPLRAELQQLEAELSRGTPLKDALSRRQLPLLFSRMVELGAHSNDLPGVLTLLADHYRRVNGLWTRLKGLLVYPMTVLLASVGLTISLSLLFSRMLAQFFDQTPQPPAALRLSMWGAPVILVVIATFCVFLFAVPGLRNRLRWRLPAFREASLAQTASAISLMLRNGTPLPEAISMAETLESGTPAAPALAHWHAALQAGQGKPIQWTGSHEPFPPLFLWLVQKSGENVAAGFQNAAEIYQARAAYRIELALYGAATGLDFVPWPHGLLANRSSAPNFHLVYEHARRFRQRLGYYARPFLQFGPVRFL